MHIPLAATATLQYDFTHIVAGHIRNNLAGFCVFNDSSFWNLDYQIGTVGSVAAALAALLTVFGNILAHMTKIRKGIQPLVHLKDDVSAFAAVTAIGTAIRNKKLPAKTDMTIAALSGLYKNFCTICKHKFFLFFLPYGEKSRRTTRRLFVNYSDTTSLGYTETCFLSLPFLS